jgi:ADP-ribose pyrophosphatase
METLPKAAINTRWHKEKARIMPRRIAEFIDKTVLSNGFFPLILCKVRHTLFAGGMSRAFTREVLFRAPVAAVLPYDPVQDTVVLIEQFRAGKLLSGAADPWMIEVVAGIIEDGETPEDMVRREAIEEAGCRIGEVEALPSFYTSAGGSSEYAYLFCGRVDSSGVGGIHGLDSEDEDIRVMVEPTDRALERLARGEVDSAIAVVALQWLALNRARLKAQWT